MCNIKTEGQKHMRVGAIMIITGLIGLMLYAFQYDDTSNMMIENEPQEDTMTEKNNIYNYAILSAGSIQPEGWIRQQLKRDLADGYIGSFDEVHPTVTHDVFVNQDRKSKRKFSMRKEWWSGEHEGYWKDAVIRMAFLTGQQDFISQADQWMNALVDASGENGYIGIYQPGNERGSRFNHTRENGELWATSRILMAMLAYYEYTGNREVLSAAQDAARLIMKNYSNENYFAKKSRGGGVSHGIGFFENLEWLYRITGKQEYLDFAEKLYEDFNSVEVRDDDLQTDQLLNEDVLFEKHGAHIAEGFFVPEFIAAIKDTAEYDEAADNAIAKLTKHTTPSGAMRCDEWIKGREGDADERYEYCGIAEMVSPLNKMIALSGDLFLADRIETMTFNAGQGSRFPVLSALSYFTKDNRIRINHREIARRESYDAAHFAAACCVLNGGRLMPYFVEGMWMRDLQNDGLAAVLYGPNSLSTRIGGTGIEIHEETGYPFTDTITFHIDPEEAVTFPLTLRKPHGCEDITLELPDGASMTERDDAFVIEHQWKKGDRVHMILDFQVQQVEQPASKSVKEKGVYVKRGAIVYALPFQHEIVPVKEHHNSGFYRYRITPENTQAWEYRLDLDGPFEFGPAEDEIRAPWDEPAVHLKVWLVDKQGTKEPFDLVPMGNTIFRRVTFSVNE